MSLKTLEEIEKLAQEYYPPATDDLICAPKLVRDAYIQGYLQCQKDMAAGKPQKKKTVTQILGPDYQARIQEYLEVFPKIKLPSGKAARSDKKNVETALAWFMANYDYSWDTILKATRNYVAEFELKNYLYMQTSQYFIRKQQADKSWGSELANRCSEVGTGTADVAQNHFKERVV